MNISINNLRIITFHGIWRTVALTAILLFWLNISFSYEVCSLCLLHSLVLTSPCQNISKCLIHYKIHYILEMYFKNIIEITQSIIVSNDLQKHSKILFVSMIKNLKEIVLQTYAKILNEHFIFRYLESIWWKTLSIYFSKNYFFIFYQTYEHEKSCLNFTNSHAKKDS